MPEISKLLEAYFHHDYEMNKKASSKYLFKDDSIQILTS